MKRVTLYALLAAVLMLASVALAQGRAYSTINFGESAAEVTEKVAQLEDIDSRVGNLFEGKDDDAIARLSGSKIEIAGHTFDMDFDFYHDQLYRVALSTIPTSATNFGTRVTDARDVLARVITSSNGPPNRELSVRLSSLQDGRVSFSHLWNANPDGAEYRIGFGERYSRFYATLWIEWIPLRDARQRLLDGIDDDSIKRAAEGF